MKNQSLIILHLRHSNNANSKQDAPDGFLVKLVAYLKNKGYLIWFIFADSRMSKSFTGIKDNKISPFCEPLKKFKDHYNALMTFEKRLKAENPGYDFSKLKHLELLLALRQLDFLKGIIGNTSGTLDVAAFIGHDVYNIHHFADKLTYQDYRMLMGLAFLSIENYVEPEVKKEKEVKNEKELGKGKIKKDRSKTQEVTQYIQNFNRWLTSQDDILFPLLLQ